EPDSQRTGEVAGARLQHGVDLGLHGGRARAGRRRFLRFRAVARSAEDRGRRRLLVDRCVRRATSGGAQGPRVAENV
ncbi:MAG: hypothetical protein AVDCRST_MAG04-2131, partial [uncultured Acetobacteraceae bacterium]